MSPFKDEWVAHRRQRFLRHDAHRFVRPDAQRFLRPAFKHLLQPGFDPLDYFRLLEGKANFNPSQPRVPRGNPRGGQWTRTGAWSGDSRSVWEAENADSRNVWDDDGGGGAGNGEEDGSDSIDQETDEDDRSELAESDDLSDEFSAVRVRYRIVGLPEPTLGQMGRLVDANVRFEQARQAIREVEPAWTSRTTSLSDPNSNEGIVRYAEARALEAEAYARRLGIGGNFGPPLEPPPFGTSLPAMRPFNGPAWIDAYRTLANTNDLFGREAWARNEGTVTVTEFGGLPIFGVNAAAPTFTISDLAAALQMRETMIKKYPATMNTYNMGGRPNDSLFHAEATVLFRAAKANGGHLKDKSLEVHVDRPVCSSCGSVLPYLGIEVGNPVITFINSVSRRRRTMWNGHWLD